MNKLFLYNIETLCHNQNKMLYIDDLNKKEISNNEIIYYYQ